MEMVQVFHSPEAKPELFFRIQFGRPDVREDQRTRFPDENRTSARQGVPPVEMGLEIARFFPVVPGDRERSNAVPEIVFPPCSEPPDSSFMPVASST